MAIGADFINTTYTFIVSILVYVTEAILRTALRHTLTTLMNFQGMGHARQIKLVQKMGLAADLSEK
jgi:hypothetical protein